MRTIILAAAIVVMATGAQGEIVTLSEIVPGNTPVFEPAFLTFSCGKGSVEISLKDGSVKLTDCTLDESAKAFWKAVELMTPMECEKRK